MFRRKLICGRLSTTIVRKKIFRLEQKVSLQLGVCDRYTFPNSLIALVRVNASPVITLIIIRIQYTSVLYIFNQRTVKKGGHACCNFNATRWRTNGVKYT